MSTSSPLCTSTSSTDTSPAQLDLAASASQDDAQTSEYRGKVGRLSQRVERKASKLGRSISAKALAVSSPSPSTPTRKLFSLSRRSRDGSGKKDSSPPDPSRTSPQNTPSSSPGVPSAQDDSPFIRPPSPTASPRRPSLLPFRGDGSMRVGTQTLIQALQAMPWAGADDADSDDDVNASGREDEEEPAAPPIASSIHTIYRPLARSQRLHLSVPALLSRRRKFPSESPVAEESDGSLNLEEDEDSAAQEVLSDDEVQDDFEDSTPRPPNAQPSSMLSAVQDQTQTQTMPQVSRGSSMATVKLQRRARLAGKLKDIFELDSINEVLAEMPCWLLRSVLLQGYMYLTNSYICFFAHMPLREDQVLKSGSLHKKAQRTKRWIKHWFVLKNDALSWYQSSADPYFPHGIVDLRYAISCDPVDDKDFRIRTNQKTILLSAYSAPSREEWVKSIRKVMFKAQNSGDSVKIAIPYSCILDVERSTAMDFSETIEVKVFEKESPFSIDSYFFAYFHDLPAALDQIRDAVRDYRNRPHLDSPQALLDTTVPKGPPMTVDRTASLPAEIPSSVSSPLTPSVSSSSRTGFRLTSLFRMPTLDARSGVPLSRGSSGESSQSASEDFTYISRRPDSFIPITTSPDMEQASETPTQSRIEHTTASATPTQIPAASSFSSLLPISVPLWLRPSRKLWGASGGQLSVLTSSNVKEVYSPHTIEDRRTNGADMAFSVLETPDVRIDTETTDKFRQAFAYDEKEILLGYFPGYLFRLLPIYGRMYVSTNYFCYKSSSRLTSRTRMAIPIRDILSLQKSKGTRFGHHGVIVIIKGHEELFFEYWAEDKRDAFVRLLQRQMEDVGRRLEAGNDSVPTQGQRDALILEEFDAPPHSAYANEDGESGSAPDVGLADSLPAVMFTSASSTFLTFKPKKSMHFTCLTIGSRGDVQPYIALAKGLMADGHRVRIATHVEFKDWIESHGIEYGYVGGDPAELMRICVENGVFTVSFLKEGLQKFRGWLDDLLKTSWEACQGTDVLIESPSAMGGYHIAEALRIPYYRAFTMTWSRTRAYPHAFAVPENRMGGSYNYMSYVLFDQVFWRAISGQINRWRRKLLNLDSTSLDKMEPHKIPFLYNFSPHVVPPPLDWPEWIRVTGYWFLNDADASGKKWTPPPDLVQFIDSAHKQGKKIVYIGFGSIVVSHPKAMTRCIIEAVVASGVHAVLSKGWSDRLTAKTGEASQIEEPLPKQIYPIPSIPHDWLFPRIDAACHHGGAGTTGASLRSGLPTIVHPFFGDQFFWADRVEALGVGSCIRKLTTEGLTRAFSSVTSDVKQIERAKLLGEKLRAEDGVAAAVECIYRDLEYAKSLIKRLDTDDESDHDKATHSSPEGNSGYSSSGSARLGGASSEDWSVISDQDEPRVSSSSRHSGRRRHSDGRDRQAKRHSFAAAVLSALPDALGHSSNKTAPNSPRHNSSVLPS